MAAIIDRRVSAAVSLVFVFLFLSRIALEVGASGPCREVVWREKENRLVS
jgi:hypothetical protein